MSRAAAGPAHAAGNQPAPLRNVYACLVHESPECVLDLVRNLRHLDPDSAILLYNGGRDPLLLDGPWPFDRYGAMVHPRPRPLAWGWVHEFALDCLRHALERLPFDTLTVVDSDQLALRPGYPARLAEHLRGRDRVGLLGSAPGTQPRTTQVAPAVLAYREFDLWRPFLRRFPDGEAKFVHWTFWPATVFTAPAAAALVRLWDEDAQLAAILARSKMWATEEVLLPTLVALLGFEVAASPCSYDYVRFRVPYTLAQLDAALARPDAFWVHPIPRRYDDPLRRHVRDRHRNYQDLTEGGPMTGIEPEAEPFLLTLPILARMRSIEGWLADDEADLLIAVTARALAAPGERPAVVEVGSYCGRATVVLGSVARAVCPRARVFAIDPHDGKLGAADRYVTVGPSLEKLKANIAAAGLTDVVEIVRAAAPQVPWEGGPIALLLIDGLHDYAHVAQDFSHFEPWVADGGLVAFHDYAGYFPGVVAFVDELLASGRYQRVGMASSLVVLRKRPQPPAVGEGTR
jgi:hypothetical protein